MADLAAGTGYGQGLLKVGVGLSPGTTIASRGDPLIDIQDGTTGAPVFIGAHIHNTIDNALLPIQICADSHVLIVTRINGWGAGHKAQVPAGGGRCCWVYSLYEQWVVVEVVPTVHKTGVRCPADAAAGTLSQTVGQGDGAAAVVIKDGGVEATHAATVLVVPQDAVAHAQADVVSIVHSAAIA